MYRSDTGSMGHFRSIADLNKCLHEITPRYSKYAIGLWDNNIRSPTELANVSVATLAKCGVSNVAHAENIKAQFKNAGEYSRRNAVLAQFLSKSCDCCCILTYECLAGSCKAKVFHILAHLQKKVLHTLLGNMHLRVFIGFTCSSK